MSNSEDDPAFVDPAAMDGRAIANRVYAAKDDPAALAFWSGVAIACLLDYQRALEVAGISTYRGPERRAHAREDPADDDGRIG